MSGLFNKKFASQQDIEQGQVPDHLSDQPAPIPQILPQQQADPIISHPDEDQFIFETLPDNHFESDHPKDKNNHKNQDYHSQNLPSQKKDRDRQDRYDRDKRQDKNNAQKLSLKKQSYNQDIKRKPEPQEDSQIRQPHTGSIHPVPMGYYPGMAPPISSPYNPQAYYPPYGSMPPAQPGTRPPYGMYSQLHHQPPPGMYAPPSHQNIYPVPNPNIYQIPPPPIAYGSIQPIVQPIPPEMYHPQLIDPLRSLNDQVKPYNYDQQRAYPDNPAYSYPKSYQNRQKQDQRQKNFKDKHSENWYSDERQRSRDRKDRNDSETTKGQQKLRHYDKKNSHDQNSKQRSKDQYSQHQKASIAKQQKKVKQDEDKLKLKTNINDQLSIIFSNDQQAKEEFLLVLRDVLKQKLLKKEEEEMEKYHGYDLARPTAVYSLNKDLIQSNYNKALLRIENLLMNLAQTESKTEGNLSAFDKKDALIYILGSLQIQDIVSKVKEMRLKKKLLGERKMSEIKKILDELVKDPRKRIK